MPPDQPEFASIRSRFACEVYWGDCDPAGIIFYPTYFRWFDSATWAFFASVGYTAKRMRAEGRSMPLVAAECEFIHPAEQADRCDGKPDDPRGCQDRRAREDERGPVLFVFFGEEYR